MDTFILRQLCLVALLSGLLAVLCSATSTGKKLEEHFGLLFLYSLRGHRSPPQEAVVLAIERRSAEYFGLKPQPYKWPRSLHGRTIDILTGMDVVAVGIDMFFEETRSLEDDQKFAQSLHKSDRVVLLQRLRKIVDYNGVLRDDGPGVGDRIVSEQIIPPVPLLEQAAFALAPLPLPQTPVRVNQAWLFKEGIGNQPSLPVVMFAMIVAPFFDRFVELVEMVEPALAEKYKPLLLKKNISRRLDLVLQDWRSVFLVETRLQKEMLDFLEGSIWGRGLHREEKLRLQSIITLLGGNGSVFINYYGPPGTILNLPYFSLFTADNSKRVPDLSGKAVFIGLSHEAEMGEKDGFYTVYTTDQGKHISGVEIAATMFANLLDGSSLRPVSPLVAMAFICLLGFATAAIASFFNPILAGFLTFIFSLLYVGFTAFLFTGYYLWSPLIIPVMIQVPLTYLAITLLKHGRTARERLNYQKALGCYLPGNIVTQIEKDYSLLANSRQISEGVCLFSDIENYTSLSERFSQEEVDGLVNNYYEEMFQIVKRHSGMILDVRGDSMLALWTGNGPGSQGRTAAQACRAAWAISRVFNNKNGSLSCYLPTRMGLHQGRLSMGNIGASGHYQYTVTGDTVNTAARIESLAKQLGTKLLVSERIARQINGMRFQRLGTFVLVGKTQPLTICEPRGSTDDADDQEKKLEHLYGMGLQSFELGCLEQSLDFFQKCSSLAPDYGPALWFQEVCGEYLADPQLWRKGGVIYLKRK